MRSKAWAALSRHIGSGRCSGHGDQGEVLLTMEQCGGAGLLWSLTVAGQVCRAWCDEAAWCRWIEPLLPVQSLAHIDTMLLAPLANWSWLPISEKLAAGGGLDAVQVATPSNGFVKPDWDAVLTLVRNGARLSLRLIDWPAKWLMDSSTNWPAAELSSLFSSYSGHSLSAIPPVAITVAAGWCALPSRSLEEIQLGEGLLLSGPVDLQQGVAWLFHTRPLAKIRLSTTNHAKIEATMADSYEWPPETDSEADDIILTVVAEIGQLVLPLERLSALAVGEILQGESLFDGEVRLKINNRYLGSGSLIEVGGRWVVRVDRWFNQQPAALTSRPSDDKGHDTTACNHSSCTQEHLHGDLVQQPRDDTIEAGVNSIEDTMMEQHETEPHETATYETVHQIIS